MAQLQIWQHNSGEQYAVLVDVVRAVAAIGPLHHSEIEVVKSDPNIVSINSSAELVDDLNGELGERCTSVYYAAEPEASIAEIEALADEIDALKQRRS